MSYITAVGTATPKNKFSQVELANFMANAMGLDYNDSRKLRTIFKASGIEYRYSVLEDYGREKDFSFYPNTENFEPFPSTKSRMEIFREHAVTLSTRAAENALADRPGLDKNTITHLIVVCCTGMYAPGLDIDLVKSLSLPTSIQRTSITFMGCYAAFNALKVANAFCKSTSDAKVLIVCTELCSLHFQKKATQDNLLSNAIFADGSAAVIMESVTDAKLRLKPEIFQSDLISEGENDMAWSVGDVGFEMKLSTYVPAIIKGGIGKLASSLLESLSKKISEIQYFAIHPGGKKILEVIELELNVTKEQNAAAYHVLKNFGNMSSPTVLFVLAEIINKLSTKDNGQHILSFAFGPGLTLESMILKVETT
jgi:predicted naringenin-chalcone synthase